MAFASFSSMERPIIRLCNPRLTCFFPTSLYKGPRDDPMDKIVEYDNVQTNLLIVFKAVYCHSPAMKASFLLTYLVRFLTIDTQGLLPKPLLFQNILNCFPHRPLSAIGSANIVSYLFYFCHSILRCYS